MELAYLKLTCFEILSWRHQIGSLGKTKHNPGIFLLQLEMHELGH